MKRPEVKRYELEWSLRNHADIKIVEVNSKSGMTLAQAKKEVDTIVKFFTKYEEELRMFPWEKHQGRKEFNAFLRKLGDNAKRATEKSIEEESQDNDDLEWFT